MKIRIKLAFLLLFLIATLPVLKAQNSIFMGGAEEDIGNSIKQYEGRFYIAGTTRKTSANATDYYVLELNNNGGLEHQYIFGGPHIDLGNDIIVRDAGIFLLGKTWDGGYGRNDMYMCKMDFDGNLKWSKFYGGVSDDLGQKFIVTKDGGFAMVGHNRSFDGLGDIYVVKANINGEKIWENHFGGKYIDYGFDLIENEQGEFIVVGSLGGFYNPSSFEFGNHDADIFIIKTNAQGEKIWEKTFGGNGHDWPKKIIAAPGGGYFICGSTQSEGAGSFDMFLMKMDENGNELWMKTYGGTNFEYGESVQTNAENNLYLLGTSASFSDNKKPDHFLVKTDQNGEVIWEKTFGGVGSDYSSSLISLADSGCVFTGWTNQGTLGKKDIVLYKVSTEGKIQILSDSMSFEDIITVYVYPNPTVDFIDVEIIINKQNPYLFSLYDVNGKKVFQQQIEANSKTRIPLAEESGAYFYKIENEDKVSYTGKLIIQN